METISFWCEHPSIPLTVVDSKPLAIRCSIMRDSGGWESVYKGIPKFCGPSAELYEPKPTLMEKVCKLLKLK